MKRFYFIIILAVFCGMTAMAQDRPNITHQSTGGNRGGFAIIVDRPTLYFDSENRAIQVYGCESEYYDFTITEKTSQAIMISGRIDGNFDTIDATTLVNGTTYTILFTSANGNCYQWTFDGELITGIFPDGIGPKVDLERSDSHTGRIMQPDLY